MDKNDPILGFFHEWTLHFAKNFEKVIVVCLEKGEYDLPENVEVHSLGKEEGTSKIKRILNFYKIILKKNREYSGVFIHMNPEYAILGGITWRIWRKKVALWYNHTYGSFKTKLAMRLVDKVFHTSPYAYTADSKKAQRMPAGIDAEKFTPGERERNSPQKILSLGRISPVKRVHVLLSAAQKLASEGYNFTLDIYGGSDKGKEGYVEECKQATKVLQEKGIVNFYYPVPNEQTPEIYRDHDIFVNLTPAGNYDKTVIEAMACRNIVVASSPAFSDIIPEKLRPEEENPDDLVTKIKTALEMPEEEYNQFTLEFRQYIIENHSLSKLMNELFSFYEQK